MSTIIGVDNGCSGSVGIIRDGVAVHFGPVPTQDYLHYGKKGTISQRLDRMALDKILLWDAANSGFAARVYVERPFTAGPRMMNAAISAARFFEATIITLEDLGLGYEVIDSGVWQKPILGNVKGSAELKHASKLRGQQMYPQFKDAITKQGDADALLIAHRFAFPTHA